ncbi:in LEU2 3 region [Lecanosticta acicola]|uniref:In LEU2 3 region n=1 Tax=Lecanosticta acicola TaxID=111012 RepID=A0AAI8Z9I0_9PEZI|nr:in LEU2 3 region [Lecanosticta acicola]
MSRLTRRNAAHFAIFYLLTTSALAQIARAHDGSIMEVRQLHKRATSAGCFSSSTPLTSKGSYQYQSSGYCGQQCKSQAVFAMTGGDTCLCGDELPAASDKVDDSKCSTSCTGYPSDKCGGDGFYSVYLTGTESDVPNYSASSSSSSSSSDSPTTATTASSTKTTKAPTSTLALITSEVAQGSTVVITAYQPVSTLPDASASAKSSGGGGTSTAGVAAGVVVGVVALAGIVTGLFFFLRHKKRQQAEEDFKQRNTVADFMRGANERKPPGTGYSGMSDQRLDPEAGARRNSVGSLADNQDYSRRILRVANPDSS